MPKVRTGKGLVDIVSWDIKYPTSANACDGSITNLFIEGGTPPYTLVWTGASSYSARTYNVENLCVGSYSATATDTRGEGCIIGITLSGTPTISLSASVIDNSCVNDFTKFCKIRVTDFKHNQPDFTYVLYKDGKVEDYFVGKSGEEIYTFSELERGDYYLTAFDGVVVNTKGINELTPYCTGTTYCSGTCVTSNITSPTRYQPESIFTNYDKFNFFANYNFYFGGHGPGSSTYLNSSTTNFYSGINKTGTTTNNPNVWLYTGNSANRTTENSTDWYLGTTAITMNQGKAITDTIYSTTASTVISKTSVNAGRFMYNTTIDKFLMLWYTDVGLADYEWVTVEPDSDQGDNGNPSAAYWLTTTLNWNTSGLTPHQMTVSGNNNTVVSATTKMSESSYPSTMLADFSNASMVSGVISDCSYKTYVHEVTLGADGMDDDDIGIVLAQFRDTSAQFGPSGQTYNLTLNFNNSTDSSTKIYYNYGNSAFAFISGNTSGAPYTGVSYQSVLLKNDESPFSTANYRNQGSVRVKITRSGEFGELFSIRMTDTMGNTGSTDTDATVNVGQTNPYNSTYDIDFSLLDNSTWSGSSISAPNYATGNELIKFIGPQKYGYFTSSQLNGQFYDMYFSGETITNTTSFVGEAFNLTSASTLNVIQTTGCNFVGWNCNQGVPQVDPSINMYIQTLPGPAMEITGATPIEGYDINDYYIYSGDAQSLDFGFIWSANTKDMTNKFALPKINIFPYDFYSKRFLGNSIYQRIFDNYTVLPTQERKNGQGLQTIDNINLQTLETDKYWEYIIKPSALYKDKVDSRLENWFDTLYLGESSNYKFGIYNNKTDRYFVITDQPEITYRKGSSFRFTGNTGIELKHFTTAVTETYESTMTGSTLVALPLRFQGAVQTIVNGVTLLQASDNSFLDGDFITIGGQFIKLKPNTVKIGDKLDFYFVPSRGIQNSYTTQQITIPTTVPTSSAATFYQNGHFYFINLDFEPIGEIKVIINGLINTTTSLIGKKTLRIDYPNYPTLTSNDSLVLCYVSVLDVTGDAMVKNPSVGYYFQHDPRFEEKVTLNVFNNNGKPVYNTSKIFNKNKSYGTSQNLTIKTDTFGDFYYNLVVEREYMLINGDTIKRNNKTKDVNFHLASGVYYGKPLTVNTVNTSESYE